jgi:hypothetical protein
MPVITSGKRQYIVSTDTLVGWKRFQRECPDYAEVLEQDGDVLRVQGGTAESLKVCRITGKQVEEL